MSALNDIAKIKKHKLKSFQKEINAIRSGFLSDKIIQEWKELPDSERKLKITVFLCMAMVSEKDLEHIAKIINPWWEPYQIVAKVLAALLVLFFSFQLATFILAKRVYPKVFEHEVALIDGSVKKYGLFDGSSMIYKDTDSGAVLLDAGIFDWLIMDSKTTRFDSTKWTSDKVLFEELNNFFADFQDKKYAVLLTKLKSVPLSIDKIYESVKNVSGLKSIQMDLSVPEGLLNSHSPFFLFAQPDSSAFFLSSTDGMNYWNTKIDFTKDKIYNVEQIRFDAVNLPENKFNLIWDESGRYGIPVLKKYFKDSSLKVSYNYEIRYVNTPNATLQ